MANIFGDSNKLNIFQSRTTRPQENMTNQAAHGRNPNDLSETLEIFPSDRFKQEELIGQGSYGQVYKTWDNLRQKVSKKCIK